MSPEPGTIWWCDGTALEFEANFKRRPVLILAIRDDASLVVAPLSSHRRYGQEQEVAHSGGVSYMTGTVSCIIADALLKPLGRWEGFEAWREQQNVEAGPSLWERISRFWERFVRR